MRTSNVLVTVIGENLMESLISFKLSKQIQLCNNINKNISYIHKCQVNEMS